MRKLILWMATVTILVPAMQVAAARAQTKDVGEASKSEAQKTEGFKPQQKESKGSVTVGGHLINYDAVAGTLVVHPKGWDDVPQNADKEQKEDTYRYYYKVF